MSHATLDPKLMELGFEVANLQQALHAAQSSLEESQRTFSQSLKQVEQGKEEELSKLKMRILELERQADLAKRESDKYLRELKQSKEKLSSVDKERKALKALDPERLKSNLSKTKARYTEARDLLKTAQADNQRLKKSLEGALSKLEHSRDVLSAAISGSDWLYRSKDEKWGLYLNTVKLQTPFDSIGYKLTALSQVTGEGHMYVRNHDADSDTVVGVWLTGESELPDDIIEVAQIELSSLHTQDRLSDERTKLKDLSQEDREALIDKLTSTPKRKKR